MALTLIEAAKQYDGDVVRQAVIELYAGSSGVLANLPFDNIEGNALKYNREEMLPGVGFRGVNEAYTESTGVLNPITETLAIAGGDLDVDTAIVATMGMSQRATQESMKIRALGLAWTSRFIKGDTGVNPREIDGLQTRLIGGQVINAGATSGGDQLSLIMLDTLIDQVVDATHLIMNKTMRRRLSQASRAASIGGFITYTTDSFGNQVAHYAGLPIITLDLDNMQSPILPFTEANPGGGAAASTSIYAVSFKEGMMTGLQNDDIQARDLGELQTKPAFRTRVEWMSGLACYHGRCAARLCGLKDAVAVA